MQKVIITIDRQYGSGGSEIGTRVGELLGIPKYDEEFVSLAAKDDSTVTEESLEKVDERATSSFLYTSLWEARITLSALRVTTSCGSVTCSMVCT